MSKPLNFNKVKKQYLTVTLADPDETTIMIGTPTKAIMDDLMILSDQIDETGEEVSKDTMDDLYHACARVMSRNKGGIHITSEFLANIFDFEDVIIFFNAYMEFIGEVTNSKN